MGSHLSNLQLRFAILEEVGYAPVFLHPVFEPSDDAGVGRIV